jgi:hypothetical protein
VTEDRIKVVPPNDSPEAGIAKAEKRFGVCTNIRNLHPIVAIQKRNIPLNGCVKIGVVAGVSSPQTTVGDLQIDLGVFGHPPQQRGHILNGVRTDNKNPVGSFGHVLPRKLSKLADI